MDDHPTLDPELAGFERRIWRDLGGDGLGELLLGAALLCFGLGMTAEWGVLAALGPAICVMNYQPLRRLLIEPRRGVVRLRAERRRFLRRARVKLVALQVALVLAGVGIWMATASGTARERMKDILPLLVMLPFPVSVAAIGVWLDAPRLLVHAGLLLAAVAACFFAGAEDGSALIIGGGLLLLHGARLLAAFLRAHPRATPQ
jgi:hypothetical protein